MSFNPPGALTSEGWRSFDNEFYFKAPIRYWFHRDFRKIFVYPVKWKYEAISLWIRYRTFNRYHVVKTGLPPGYHEVDTIMLNTNFNLLKDFVEIQQASREYWQDEVKKTWCEQHMPFYRVFYPFHRPDLGIKHLQWEATLDDPSLPLHEQSPQQAIHAREILALYKWWVEDRPNRIPVEIRRPEVDTDDMFNPKFKNTPEYKRYRADIEKSYKQSEKWDKEDDKMLVRLIKSRRGLWT
jgi:hypothetical protein